MKRRGFIRNTGAAMAGLYLSPGINNTSLSVPDPGSQAKVKVTVMNPRMRLPVGVIIDDSTCLVNLNRFAMPQFDLAFEGTNKTYHRNWKEWPEEIPDSFVRKFGEWAATNEVKGKYSVVPYPACVGRLDRFLPGWTQKELQDSINLVRSLLMPNWDIHPEMITHTRLIDLHTGHPYPNLERGFMENWYPAKGRSVDEVAAYMHYALSILRDAGLPCEGITTPGGFGKDDLYITSKAVLQSVRSVFGARVPNYFTDLITEGTASVEPKIEHVSDIDSTDPKCVVQIIGCTDDWTGGWDNVPVGGADKFITADLKSGRMVEVIERGEPAFMFGHWTGIYWNGQELGFKVLQEVVKRLHQRYDNLVWMKNSELARYWAAKTLTQVQWDDKSISLRAPFTCPDFTLKIESAPKGNLLMRSGNDTIPFLEVKGTLNLVPGSWCWQGRDKIACFALPVERSSIELVA